MDLSWLGLIIPLSYILISTFFFVFPNILHKRKKYKYPPFNDLIESNALFCIGHRGGGWEGPENTI
jgi:glycerophosphoryl diester phosphodiesterase